MGNYSVYAHTNNTNGKIYIGITKLNPQKRWGKNGNGYKEQVKFYNAIQMYGWDGFTHEIVASNLTKEEAENFEITLIEMFDSIKNGYNIKKGGCVIGCFTEETIEKIGLKRGKHSLAKKCTIDNIIFDCVMDLCDYLKDRKYKTILMYLQGERKMPKDLADRGLKYVDEELNKNIKYCSTYSNTHEFEPILYKGEIYSNMQTCAETIGTSRVNIENWLKGKQRMPLEHYNNGLKYQNEELNKNIKPKISERKQSNIILCDNQKFSSIKMVSEYIGRDRNVVANWLNGKSSMPKEWYDRGLRYENAELNKNIFIRKG